MLVLCWFFQARINYGNLFTELNKGLHLTFVERAAGRREQSRWQSSLFTGGEFGKGVGSTSDVGWDSQTCLLMSPEQSQESCGGEGRCLPNPQQSPVFVLCLQRLLTTVSPVPLLLVALVSALAGGTPSQEKVVGIQHEEGCFSQGLLWAALVWVWFVNPFPSRSLGRCSSLHLQKANNTEGEFWEATHWLEMQPRC